MHLSWNEVRARATAFANDWRDAAYEKGETQSFYSAFFQVFGVQRRSVARYEAHVAKLDNRIGLRDRPGFRLHLLSGSQVLLMDSQRDYPVP